MYCAKCGEYTQYRASPFGGGVTYVVSEDSDPNGSIVLKPPGGYIVDLTGTIPGFRARIHRCDYGTH